MPRQHLYITEVCNMILREKAHDMWEDASNARGHQGINLTKEGMEGLCKGLYEVRVHLNRRPAPEDCSIVATQREALSVAMPALVRVVYVWVLIAHVQDPLRERYLACVAHVSPCCVEAHDCLHLEASPGDLPEQALICREIIRPRPGPLDEAPPYVDHDTLDPRLFERVQRDLQRTLLFQYADPLAIPLYYPDRIQWEHHENRTALLVIRGWRTRRLWLWLRFKIAGLDSLVIKQYCRGRCLHSLTILFQQPTNKSM